MNSNPHRKNLIPSRANTLLARQIQGDELEVCVWGFFEGGVYYLEAPRFKTAFGSG